MRFVVREFEETSKTGNPFNSIGIGIKENDYLVLPSPLSNFIKREYRNKGKSINSQRNAAYAVTRFLNFLFQNLQQYNELKIGGLSNLNLQHGADYISHLSLKSRANKLNSDYVKSEIQYINRFYHWLHEQQILNDKISVSYKTINYGRKAIEIKNNLFESSPDLDVLLPTRNNIQTNIIKDFGKNRNRLIVDFITTAKKVEPLIVLGIVLQFFSGLRRSEVINLKISSFKWSNKNLIVEVRDNQNVLFPNTVNTADLQVKYPRDQLCICSEIIKPLYETHLSMLKKLNLDFPEAVFISDRSLAPLRGKAYSAKIDKVKEHFLEHLLEKNEIEDYILLSSNKWSTHIGRGIFTNILIDLGLTPTQIALARGDRSLQSALSYVDENTLINSMNFALSNFEVLKGI